MLEDGGYGRKNFRNNVCVNNDEVDKEMEVIIRAGITGDLKQCDP